MSKEIFISASEELIEEYLEQNPGTSEAEAYEKTMHAIDDRYREKLGGMIYAARNSAKD